MNVSLYFSKIDELVRIIKFLENENIDASINYSMELPPQYAQDKYKKRFFHELIENRENLEIILNNIGSYGPSFNSIFGYILHNYDTYQLSNINLIIDKALAAGYVPRLNMMGDEYELLRLYKKTQNKNSITEIY